MVLAGIKKGTEQRSSKILRADPATVKGARTKYRQRATTLAINACRIEFYFCRKAAKKGRNVLYTMVSVRRGRIHRRSWEALLRRWGFVIQNPQVTKHRDAKVTAGLWLAS